MAWEFTITVSVGFLLLGISLVRYYQLTPRPNYDFNVLALHAFGVGGVFGYVIVPTLWLIVSYAMHKGTIEENLLPGSGVESLMISMILGSLATTWSTGKAFYRYLNTQTTSES